MSCDRYLPPFQLASNKQSQWGTLSFNICSDLLNSCGGKVIKSGPTLLPGLATGLLFQVVIVSQRTICIVEQKGSLTLHFLLCHTRPIMMKPENRSELFQKGVTRTRQINRLFHILPLHKQESSSFIDKDCAVLWILLQKVISGVGMRNHSPCL